MRTAEVQAMATEKQTTANTECTREAGSFTRRIGSTTYRVGIRFSDTSRETAGDKISRIIRGEAVNLATGMVLGRIVSQ